MHQRFKVCILDYGRGKPQEPQKGCVPCTRNSRLSVLLPRCSSRCSVLSV
nr:MAG TPA: hypothetical protein [Caudoviricetes sp.]